MSELIIPRRKFLLGLAGLFCAPAIVRISSLMPIKALPDPLIMTDTMGAWIADPRTQYGFYVFLQPSTGTASVRHQYIGPISEQEVVEAGSVLDAAIKKAMIEKWPVES